jgi:hypothetical protein
MYPPIRHKCLGMKHLRILTECLQDGSIHARNAAARLGKSDGGSALRSFAGMRWSGIRGTPSSGSRSFFVNRELISEN